VDYGQVEAKDLLKGDAKAVEEGLRALWGVVRKAADELQRLRTEGHELRSRILELESELSSAQRELQEKEEHLRRMEDQQEKAEAARSISFNGDRQLLSARVKELLAKIDSYL
jgi:chromosome segregation ATPase